MKAVQAKRKWRSVEIVRFLFRVCVVLVFLSPLFIILSISLKTEADFMRTGCMPTGELTLQNYYTVWKEAGIPQAAGTSIIITVLSIAGQVFFGTMAAYALSKMKFCRAKTFHSLFLVPMVFSIQTIIFPLFLMYNKLNLLNTKRGLIIIYIAIGLPTCIFLMTKFLKSIPYEISEAALIDGAGHVRIFLQIILPLCKTQIATIAIINGLSVWNDFFLPLMMFTDGKISTLPLSIHLFSTQYQMKWTLISADIIMMLLPMLVFYLCLQKYIVNGVAAGAVKG